MDTGEAAAIPPGDDRSMSLEQAHAALVRGVLPMAAAVLIGFGLLYGWSALVAGAGWWFARPFVGIGALVLGIIVHEGLHALGWLVAGKLPVRAIRFGVIWWALAPYAHAVEPMTARAYRIGAALPGIAIGLIPLATAFLLGDGALMLFGWLFSLAAGGDYVSIRALRGVNGDRRVVDHPSRVGGIVLDDPGRTASP
ncbi:hypothetical protein BH23BAC4_BH23BAC4_11870 [soil metagenome]